MRNHLHFSILLTAAAFVLVNGFTAQSTTAPGPAAAIVGSGDLNITYILPKFSFAPGEVPIWGEGLDTVIEVTLDGDPIPIIFQNPTNMIVAPPARAPGFPILRATNGIDAVSRQARMWPNLIARTDGIGGRVRVSLANGGAGLFVLGYSTERLSTPLIVLDPPTWYGCLLDLNSVHATLATGLFFTAESRHLTFPVPDDPALTGMTIYFQAWCGQIDTGPHPTWSFTNLGSVTF